MTYQEIGKVLNISAAKVQVIERIALRKVMMNPEYRKMREYLEDLQYIESHYETMFW